MQPLVTSFFHPPSCTWTHVIVDPATRHAAVVDPVLDFDFASGTTATDSIHVVTAHLQASRLKLDWILETHAHADHLSAAQHLRTSMGGQLAVGEDIRRVQAHFREALNFEPQFRSDGLQFDHLFRDGDRFPIGRLDAHVIATPGHTLDSISYLVGDALFVGDTLFMPDGGTARCDFPGGDAGGLYDSIQRLFALPESTRIFVCHDYAPGGREHRCATTLGAQRRDNIHVHTGISREQFIRLRNERDRTLAAPALLYPSVQVNVRGGKLPPAEANGQSYLKIPVQQPDRKSA